MKPLLILTAAFILLTFSGNTQNSIAVDWVKIYGAYPGGQATQVLALKDGGYLVASSNANDTLSSGETGYNLWIIKLNGSGDIIWQKTYVGGIGADRPSSLVEMKDGNYIIACRSEVAAVGGFANDDVWVLKLDTSGNILWQKKYGGTNLEQPGKIKPTPDNGFVFVATTLSNNGQVSGNHGANDVWLVKLDSIGNIQWQKTYGGSDDDQGISVEITPDGGYIVAANTRSYDGDTHDSTFFVYTDYDCWVFKVDKFGNKQWARRYDISTDKCVSVQRMGTADKYLIAANVEFLSGPSSIVPQPMMLEVDGAGNSVYEKRFTEPGDGSEVESILQLPDGGYVTCGFSNVANISSYGWVARYDSTFNLLHREIAYDNRGQDGYAATEFHDIALTKDGGVIAVGLNYVLDPIRLPYPKSTIVKFNAQLLPLTFLKVSATLRPQDVQLQWQTVNEQNTGYFTIQRSTNAVNFTGIAKVQATGNNAAVKNYSFIDGTALKVSSQGRLFYRVLEVDKDGKTTLSKIVSVNIPASTLQLTVTPNPVKNMLGIGLNNYSGKATVTITAIGGKTVLQVEQNMGDNNTNMVNIANLSAGVYIVSAVLDNGTTVHQKFIKQ